MSLTRWTAFAVGFAVCFCLWMLRNRALDTTGLGYDGINQTSMILAVNPGDPESALRTVPQILKDAVSYLKWHIIYNIPRQTIPGGWIPGFSTALGYLAPFVGASLTILIVLGALTASAVLPIALVVAPMALLYLLPLAGGSPRYWTNVSFLLVLATAIRMGPWLERFVPRVQFSVLAGLTVVSLVSLSLYIAEHERQPYHSADYRALAELYDEIATRRIALASVYAPNQHAFHIRTGLRSPMYAPGRGIDPPVSHAVMRADDWKPECLPGRIVIEHAPWLLVELAHEERVSMVKRSLEVNCRAGG